LVSAVISYVLWRSLSILTYCVNSTSKITFVLIFRPVYKWVVSISQQIKIWILFNHPKDIFPVFVLFCIWRCLWYAGFIFSDPLSKFYSAKFRSVFSRWGQTHYFIWASYAAEHGMVLIGKYRTEGSMFTPYAYHRLGWIEIVLFNEVCSTRG
jgi:hypothetical protein